MPGVLGVQGLFADHVPAPAVVLDLHLVFGMHRIFLALDVLFAQQRIDEEVSETIETFAQPTVFDVEKIVGVIQRGVGVRRTAVGSDARWKLSTSGYFSVPINNMCSKKCARPGCESGS